MLKTIHFTAAITATITVALFLTSTVIVELFGSHVAIANVKQVIVYGLAILVPAMAVTGASGNKLGGGAASGSVGMKRRRMMVIAGNGLLILVPAALLLNRLAQAGDFGAVFYLIQALELTAGSLNLWLMGRNIRSGLQMSGRFT